MGSSSAPHMTSAMTDRLGAMARAAVSSVLALGIASCAELPTGPKVGPDISMPPGLWAIAYGGERMVAVGKRETWSTTDSPSSTWKALADTAVVVWSGDSGATWNPVDLPVRRGWLRDVAFGNTVFVALGGVGDWLVADGYVLRSEDGASWSVHAAPLDLKCNWITYFTDQFFASCSEGAGADTRNVIARSEDGVAWQRVAALAGFDAPVTSGGDVLVRWLYGDLHWSEDGATWHPHPRLFPEVEDGRPVQATIRNVRHIDEGFIGSAVTVQVVAPCCTGTPTAYTLQSADGRTWTAERTESAVGFQAHARGNGVFVGVGADGLYRTEGLDAWTRTHPFAGPRGEVYFDVAFMGGRFVAVGTGAILTSVDGMNWSLTPVPLL
jgi:hypothetical protein